MLEYKILGANTSSLYLYSCGKSKEAQVPKYKILGANISSLYLYSCGKSKEAQVLEYELLGSHISIYIYIFDSLLLEKQSKFPRYNMKCRGKHDTT